MSVASDSFGGNQEVLSDDQDCFTVDNNNSATLSDRNWIENMVHDTVGNSGVVGYTRDHPEEMIQEGIIDTESNCSMEDAVAKLEYALRKNFKAAQAAGACEEDEGECDSYCFVQEGIIVLFKKVSDKYTY